MPANTSSLKLTKRTVDALKPKPWRYDVWDSELSGFGLRIEASGTKTFIVRYRAQGGGRRAPRRFMTVGRYGVVTPEKARKNAKEILGSVAGGDDPAGDRSAKRKEMTVTELCDLYLDEGVADKAEMTVRYDKSRIKHHIKPLLGRKRIGDVTTADISKFMYDIAKGKTAMDEKVGPRARVIIRGGEGAASRNVGLLGGIFQFAVSRRFLTSNPVRGVKRFKDKQSERFLSFAEMKKLGTALEQVEKEGANPHAVKIIRLLIFTGARRNEIAGLLWSEVDFQRAAMRLTAERHKAGHKSGQGKIIPLSPPALEVLADVKPEKDVPFVFPSMTGKSQFQGIKSVWKRVREISKLKDVRLHDLRHTFASTALAGGDTLSMIGALLGHANIRTTNRYAHLADDPKAAAANRVAGTIQAAMTGKKQAKVVPFPRSAAKRAQARKSRKKN